MTIATTGCAIISAAALAVAALSCDSGVQQVQDQCEHPQMVSDLPITEILVPPMCNIVRSIRSCAYAVPDQYNELVQSVEAFSYYLLHRSSYGRSMSDACYVVPISQAQLRIVQALARLHESLAFVLQRDIVPLYGDEYSQNILCKLGHRQQLLLGVVAELKGSLIKDVVSQTGGGGM